MTKEQEQREEDLNVALLDAYIEQQHYIERRIDTLLAKYSIFFSQADKKVKQLLFDYEGINNWTPRRREKLLDAVLEQEAETKRAYLEAIFRELEELSVSSGQFIQEQLKDSEDELLLLGVQDKPNYLTDATIWAHRNTVPFILGDKEYDVDLFIPALMEIRQELFIPAIKAGFSKNQTGAEISNTLFKKGGVSTTAYNAMQKNLDTVTHHITTTGTEAVVSANDKIYKGEVWNAILDSVTCTVCMSLDGKVRYFDQRSGKSTLPDGIYPPVHFHCRCKLVPFVGNKKPHRETYNEWFERQNEGTQIRILGEKKYNLYQKGKVKVNQFAKNQDILTVKELNKIYNK